MVAASFILYTTFKSLILSLVAKCRFCSTVKWEKTFSEFSPPQVMMMVLPLLIFVLLPKVVNTSDPDMRRVR